MADICQLLCFGKMKMTGSLSDRFNGSRWYVSKINVPINGKNRGADIIIFDKENKETYLFDVKYFSENIKLQSGHLEDPIFLNYINKNFGTIKGRAVLYNGSTNDSGTIPMISASLFLKKLYQERKTDNIMISNILLFVCKNIGAHDQ